jgi:3-hydroxyisobutyrate dehydrogenase and related beta-hydroxyacid dehydrogenases
MLGRLGLGPNIPLQITPPTPTVALTPSLQVVHIPDILLVQVLSIVRILHSVIYSIMSKPSVGFVGLGAMGFGMATHLVKEGYPVHGFDVFPASVDRFKAAGG